MSVKALNPEDVKYLAVHCAATPPHLDIGAVEIDRMHRLRGFLRIGYHFVIRRNGEVETGRALDERGAHVEDYNYCSIGICMVGGVDASKAMRPQNNFTPEQFTALAGVLQDLKARFPAAVIQGHRDFPNVAKACPSFDVKKWLSTQNL